MFVCVCEKRTEAMIEVGLTVDRESKRDYGGKGSERAAATAI